MPSFLLAQDELGNSSLRGSVRRKDHWWRVTHLLPPSLLSCLTSASLHSARRLNNKHGYLQVSERWSQCSAPSLFLEIRVTCTFDSRRERLRRLLQPRLKAHLSVAGAILETPETRRVHSPSRKGGRQGSRLKGVRSSWVVRGSGERQTMAELPSDSMCKAKEHSLLVGRWYGRNHMAKKCWLPFLKTTHIFSKKHKQNQSSMMEKGVRSGSRLPAFVPRFHR